MFRKFKISNRLPNRYFCENCRWVPLICERFEPRTNFIGSLSRIVRVNAVLNNTVVESDCAVVILKLSPAVSYIRSSLHHVRVILRTHRPPLSWLETSLPAGIAEVNMNSRVPFKPEWIFFRLSFSSCLYCVHNCDDLYLLSLLKRY